MHRDMNQKTRLQTLHLKCENTLSDFKRKRRDIYLMNGDTHWYDDHIAKVECVKNKIQEEILNVQLIEDDTCVDTILNDYSLLNIEDVLISSIRRELENIDKEQWYDSHFGRWEKLPERQECSNHSLEDRLKYSMQRCEMFDYLEYKYKTMIFGPNLASRLEFF